MDPNVIKLAMGAAGAGGVPGYQLWSWGNNQFGQLGNGTTTSSSSPAQVGSLTNWSSVTGGLYFALAVKNDGTLWAWGRNSQGELGTSNQTYYSSPVQVGALTNWAKVVASESNWTLALKTDGTLWAWGQNAFGQLGQGNTTYRSSPVQIGSNTNWANIAASSGGAFAITTAGAIYSWGANGIGQLGLGNTTSYSSPKQIGSLTNWSKIDCSEAHTVAIKTDGTLWAWGKNSDGRLGLGDTTNRSSPVQVGTQTYWTHCFAGGDGYSLAVGNSGRLYAWGYNGYGQLGLGNTTNYSSPKQIGLLTNWSSNIACGPNHVLAVKTDNTLWSWGLGTGGALGSGVASNRSSPVQVGALATWSFVAAGTPGSSWGLKS